MKKVFYIYWAWFLAMMIINNVGLILPLWTVNIFKILLFINFAYLPFMPMLRFLDNEKSMTNIDHIYLEGIIVSFLYRSIIYCFSYYGMSNRWELLSVMGVVMLIYYIFDIRVKIKSIEKDYFKY